MKQIGRDDLGNYIVLMSEGEIKTFNSLRDVSEGKTMDYPNLIDRPLVEADYLPALLAVSEWIQIKDRANLLHRIANQIDDGIKYQGSK